MTSTLVVHAWKSRSKLFRTISDPTRRVHACPSKLLTLRVFLRWIYGGKSSYLLNNKVDSAFSPYRSVQSTNLRQLRIALYISDSHSLTHSPIFKSRLGEQERKYKVGWHALTNVYFSFTFQSPVPYFKDSLSHFDIKSEFLLYLRIM